MPVTSKNNSKTIIFNVLALILVVAVQFGFEPSDFTEITETVGPLIILVTNIILRYKTKTPMAGVLKKKEN